MCYKYDLGVDDNHVHNKTSHTVMSDISHFDSKPKDHSWLVNTPNDIHYQQWY